MSKNGQLWEEGFLPVAGVQTSLETVFARHWVQRTLLDCAIQSWFTATVETGNTLQLQMDQSWWASVQRGMGHWKSTCQQGGVKPGVHVWTAILQVVIRLCSAFNKNKKKKKRQHARTRNSSFLLKFPSSTLCWQNLILCFLKRKKRSVSHSVMFYSLQPHELKTARLLFFFFSRQDYWSGKLLPSSGDLPNPGIKLRYLALQVDSLPSESPGKSHWRGDRLKASLLRHRRTPGGAGAERQRTDKWPESHLSSGTKTE